MLDGSLSSLHSMRHQYVGADQYQTYSRVSYANKTRIYAFGMSALFDGC